MTKEEIFKLYQAANKAAVLENTADAILERIRYARCIKDQQSTLQDAMQNGIYELFAKCAPDCIEAVAHELIKQLTTQADEYNQVIANRK